ncbi:uncharacterized protein [Spinacia oleracea]|uniref:RNase H type-1 domain-containing protein n=1 Tax=Spinacia oleracea TaxID=3562 RepID=A0A9R0K363_SPIOL|nr:uncharacterized protein LOC110796057 [Spinacia oleracea]
MLFFNANRISCKNITDVIARFCHISGQQLNVGKSHLKVSSNTSMQEKQEFVTILRMPMVTTLDHHLGSPIDLQGTKYSNFVFLIDQISKKINDWNAIPLSQTQKVILINSVLISMASHVMSCFHLPSAISSKIDSMIAQFFWDNKDRKGIHWVGRSIIHLPKGMGGLGIRSMGVVNKALLMKSVWRIHNNPQSLLARVYTKRFSSPLLTGKPTRIINGAFSWGMRGLARAGNILLKGCNWKVGDGNSILASKDRWVNGTIPEFKSTITMGEARAWRVSHFIMPTGKDWDHGKVNRCFEFDDAKQIVGMELPYNQAKDYLYWKYHKGGKFTVKTAYAMILGEDSNHSNGFDGESPFSLLWSLRMAPKWKLFIWKILRNGLATKCNINQRGLNIPSACDLCLNEDEDYQYLFRFFEIAKQTWRSGSLGIHSELRSDIPFVEWMLSYIRPFQCQDGHLSTRTIYFITTLWSIWVARNNKVFRDENVDLSMVMALITKGLEQHDITTSNSSGALRYLHPPEQHLFPPGFFGATLSDNGGNPTITTLLVDGAWNKSTKLSGLAWVKDNFGTGAGSPQGGATFGYAESAIQAEAQACLAGLRWAIRCDMKHILILTDSYCLVDMPRGGGCVDMQVKWTLAEIVARAQDSDYCSINKVDRDRIQPAHVLATGAARSLIAFSNDV